MSAEQPIKPRVSMMENLLLMVLWLACVLTAMGVVFSAFASRKATQELELLRRESSGLQVESGQYLLEKSTWAAYSRVEKIATNKLKMRVPESEKTVLVYRE